MIGIPASAGLVVVASPLTDLLFRYGQFGADDAAITVDMIAAHGVTVWVFCGLLIVNRVFYATGQHVVPVKLGMISVVANMVLNLLLIPLCSGIALPLASGAAALLQLTVSVVLLRRQNLAAGTRSLSMYGLWTVVWRSLLGTVGMVAGTAFTLNGLAAVNGHIGQGLFRLLNVVIPVAVAVISYALCLFLTRMSPLGLLRTPRLPTEEFTDL
jgi:putative peptidoglycan lipid II flippase